MLFYYINPHTKIQVFRISISKVITPKDMNFGMWTYNDIFYQ